MELPLSSTGNSISISGTITVQNNNDLSNVSTTKVKFDTQNNQHTSDIIMTDTTNNERGHSSSDQAYYPKGSNTETDFVNELLNNKDSKQVAESRLSGSANTALTSGRPKKCPVEDCHYHIKGFR